MRRFGKYVLVGRISSGIAHEMGTPLNVVAGRAKMIAGSNLDPEEIATGTRIICEQVGQIRRGYARLAFPWLSTHGGYE